MKSFTSSNLGKELLEKAFQQTEFKIKKHNADKKHKEKNANESNIDQNINKGGIEYVDKSTLPPDERTKGTLYCGCSLCQEMHSK
jgi:hypothetical protein